MIFKPIPERKKFNSLIKEPSGRRKQKSFTSLISVKKSSNTFKFIRKPSFKHSKTSNEKITIVSNSSSTDSLLAHQSVLKLNSLYSLYFKGFPKKNLTQDKRPISVSFNNFRPIFLEPDLDHFTSNKGGIPSGLSSPAYEHYQFPAFCDEQGGLTLFPAW